MAFDGDSDNDDDEDDDDSINDGDDDGDDDNDDDNDSFIKSKSAHSYNTLLTNFSLNIQD